jgi:hypothetical protein
MPFGQSPCAVQPVAVRAFNKSQKRKQACKAPLTAKCYSVHVLNIKTTMTGLCSLATEDTMEAAMSHSFSLNNGNSSVVCPSQGIRHAGQPASLSQPSNSSLLATTQEQLCRASKRAAATALHPIAPIVHPTHNQHNQYYLNFSAKT